MSSCPLHEHRSNSVVSDVHSMAYEHRSPNAAEADLRVSRIAPVFSMHFKCETAKLMNHLAGSWHHLHFDGTITILLSITMEVPRHCQRKIGLRSERRPIAFRA